MDDDGDGEVVVNNPVIYRCSGMKRNRTPCANRVRQFGAFCYLHADQDMRTPIYLRGYIPPDASRIVLMQDTMEDVRRSVTDEEQQTLSLNQIYRAHLAEDLAEEIITYNAYREDLRRRAAPARRDYHEEIRAFSNENIVGTSDTWLAGLEALIRTSRTRTAEMNEAGTSGTQVAGTSGTRTAEMNEASTAGTQVASTAGTQVAEVHEAGTSGTQVAEVNEADIPRTRTEAPLPVRSRRGSVESSNLRTTRSDIMSYMRQMAEESSLPMLVKITEMQDDIGKITNALKKASINIEECSNNEKYKCCVCYSLEKSNMFVPCNHLACCAPCAEIIMGQSGKCPVCNNHAIEQTRVYI